jgi:hypothetical protein
LGFDHGFGNFNMCVGPACQRHAQRVIKLAPLFGNGGQGGFLAATIAARNI